MIVQKQKEHRNERRRNEKEPTFRAVCAAALWLTAMLTATAGSVLAEDFPGFDARAQRLLNGLSSKGFTRNGPGKSNLPNCLARLHLTGGADTAALEYLSVESFRTVIQHPDWGNEGDPFFAWIGMVRGFYMFGNKLTPRQLDSLKTTATRFRRWFKGDLSIYPDHTNPVVAGTENHHLMTWASLYLWAQAWPDARWYRDNVSTTTYSSAEAMEKVKNLLIDRGRSMFAHGNSEFLSPIYEIFHLIPLVNLQEFATDSSVKNIAEALLAYYSTSLGVNMFEGHLTGPAARFYTTQSTGGSMAISQYIGWLYWGQGAPSDSGLYGKGDGGRYAGYLALSKWRPRSVVCKVVQGQGPLPMFSREVKPFWAAEPPRYAMKSTYRDSLYLFSAANMRTQPAYYVIDDNQFEIAWHTSDRLNSLMCSHPYWYSDRGEDDWRSSSSPFQQLVHHRTSAIVLFGIPDTDPFQTKGWNENWINDRDGHFSSLIKLGRCRYPSTVDETVRDSGWVFLREGDVYIGILPLGGSVSEATSGDWTTVKNRGNKVGFVFQMGTRRQHATFTAFREKTVGNARSFAAQPFEASYVNNDGDTLRIAFTTSLTPPDCSVPRCWVNGAEVNYAQWPSFESPVFNLKNMVLSAAIGSDCFTVDWRNRLPVVSGSCTAAQRVKPGSGMKKRSGIGPQGRVNCIDSRLRLSIAGASTNHLGRAERKIKN